MKTAIIYYAFSAKQFSSINAAISRRGIIRLSSIKSALFYNTHRRRVVCPHTVLIQRIASTTPGDSYYSAIEIKKSA